MTNEQALEVLKQMHPQSQSELSQAFDTAIRVMEGVDHLKSKCEIMASAISQSPISEQTRAFDRGRLAAYGIVLNELFYITKPPTP